jgi:cell division protein FtsW (lipid II flippase)
MDLYVSLSRYVFIILSIAFLISCIQLNYADSNNNIDKQMYYYKWQRILILIGHFIGFIILLVNNNTISCLLLYIEQVIFFITVWFILKKFYSNTSVLLWNISLYLLSISFIILARLDFNIGIRQFKLSVVGYCLALIIPFIFKKINFLNKLNVVYILLAFILLLITNDTINGAKNWFKIGSFSFQPSELVKILFVFFLAGIIPKYKSLNGIIITGGITGFLMLLLVLQKDLGTTLIFYIIYLCIIYIYTNKATYFFGGLGVGSICSLIAYKLFYHVQVRVEAWVNPFRDVNDKGFQIAHSLFAIGAGDWLGMGLYNGMPQKIPAVITDCIFAAISEEFGNVFSIILIILITLFIIDILNFSKTIKNDFYFLILVGLGLTIGFQAFLIIGGVTKLIPLTGVTLPFVSYGGTSIYVCCIMLGIIQGIYLKDDIKDNGDAIEKTN